jgi:hypothetical protein
MHWYRVIVSATKGKQFVSWDRSSSQEPALYPMLTAVENLGFFSRI